MHTQPGWMCDMQLGRREVRILPACSWCTAAASQQGAGTASRHDLSACPHP